MRILFDTNVIVDATAADRLYHAEAVALINEAESGQLSAVVAPLSFGTLWYLGTHHYGVDPRPLIGDLASIMDLAPMGRSVLDRALDHADETDFEDTYLAEAALAAGAENVVTRNESDFAPTALTAYHPAELVRMLQ